MNEEKETQENEESEQGHVWQDDQHDVLGEYYKQISRCDD